VNLTGSGIDRVAFVGNDKRNVTGKHMTVLFAAGAAVQDSVLVSRFT
jgi:hypothetical protein